MNTTTDGELAGVVEDAGAAGGEVDAVQRGAAAGARVGEGRDEPREAEELAERVDDVAAVGEAPGGAQREVHAVGEVVGAHAGAVEEVVVAVVHQRAPEHEHPLHLRAAGAPTRCCSSSSGADMTAACRSSFTLFAEKQ